MSKYYILGHDKLRLISLARIVIPLLLMLGIGTRMIVPMLSAIAALAIIGAAYRKLYSGTLTRSPKYADGKKIVYGEYSVADEEEK